MEDDNKKVEGTEEKPKSLIDRFWWVIPPVFITFVYWPLILKLGDLRYMSFERYIRELKRLVIGDIDVGRPIFFWSYFLFGFMAVGMLLTRNRSLKIRIIVPIIFAIFGSFITICIAIYTSPYALD